jgi:hypothetical protein
MRTSDRNAWVCNIVPKDKIGPTVPFCCVWKRLDRIQTPDLCREYKFHRVCMEHILTHPKKTFHGMHRNILVAHGKKWALHFAGNDLVLCTVRY